MVGTPTNVSACWRFRRRGSSTEGMMDPNSTSSAALKMRTCEQTVWRKGLNDENLHSPPSQGKNILLTFPFIEPGKWKGDSFSGHSELNPGAVSAYANAASARNEAPLVGLSTLTFHELGHETHFGEALTRQYPVTPTLSLPREAGTSSAGKRMSDAAGGQFDCSIPQGGCQ